MTIKLRSSSSKGELSIRTAVEPRDLLTESDITAEVAAITNIVREHTKDALLAISIEDEPKGCSYRLSTKSNHCPTFAYLNPDVPEYSVFNISRIGNKKLAILIDGDILDVHDVQEDIKLSIIQSNQIEVTKSKLPIIDRATIAERLSELEFPLYFLDYETVSTALPLYTMNVTHTNRYNSNTLYTFRMSQAAS